MLSPNGEKSQVFLISETILKNILNMHIIEIVKFKKCMDMRYEWAILYCESDYNLGRFSWLRLIMRLVSNTGYFFICF